MRKTKNLIVVVAALIACLAGVWFATSTHGRETTYELRPEVTLPEYRTDTARAIDAYQSMMERYMALTESNLAGLDTDIRDIARKINSIDRKLTLISYRMTAIEEALGIERPKWPTTAPPAAAPGADPNKSNVEKEK